MHETHSFCTFISKRFHLETWNTLQKKKRRQESIHIICKTFCKHTHKHLILIGVLYFLHNIFFFSFFEYFIHFLVFHWLWERERVEVLDQRKTNNDNFFFFLCAPKKSNSFFFISCVCVWVSERCISWKSKRQRGE